jgi:hypothetical protein
MAGVYTNREAAKHAQRLKEYVASAARNAIQLEPRLEETLNGELKLAL